MLDPERVCPVNAGVIAAAQFSILVFLCRKRDRDAGGRLPILDALVALRCLILNLR